MNGLIAEISAAEKNTITCLDFENGFSASKGVFFDSNKVKIKTTSKFQHSAYFNGKSATLEVPMFSNTYRYEL